MRKITVILLAIAITFAFASCGGNEPIKEKSDTTATEESATSEDAISEDPITKEAVTETPPAEDLTPEPEPATPLDLTGNWKQTNSNSDTDYQVAVIKDDTIIINWITDDSESLYWAGSFIAPTEATDKYSWKSVNDKEQTDTALLASGDDTKTIKYKNGVLSYKASAFGTIMTIKLERQ